MSYEYEKGGGAYVQHFGALVGEVGEAADGAACYDLWGGRHC